MNPIGIQYLYWNDIPLEEALDLTAAAGADVYECGTAVIHAMPPERRREFGALVRSRGLTLTLNGGMPGSDLCSPDEELRRRSIQLSQEAIQAAADAGSAVWGGIIYSKWLAIPSQSLTRQARQEMWDRGIASLRQVLPAAEQYGVDVCFEIVNRFEAFMITTVAEGIRFCEEIGSPRARLLLDAFHMNIEEDSTAAAMELAMQHGRFGHLHVSESNRGLPGLRKTNTDWRAFFAALSRVGYTGVVTMEPMVLMETPSSAKYRIWRDMVEDGTRETLLTSARKSIAFLREQMLSH